MGRKGRVDPMAQEWLQSMLDTPTGNLLPAGPPEAPRFGAKGSPDSPWQRLGPRPTAEVEVDQDPQCLPC